MSLWGRKKVLKSLDHWGFRIKQTAQCKCRFIADVWEPCSSCSDCGVGSETVCEEENQRRGGVVVVDNGRSYHLIIHAPEYRENQAFPSRKWNFLSREYLCISLIRLYGPLRQGTTGTTREGKNYCQEVVFETTGPSCLKTVYR